MIQSWVDRFLAGDRLALSRLLTMVTRDAELDAIEALVREFPQPRAVAVTGSGGVGKSTLVGRIIEHLRDRDQPLAVLACDPQSSVTGGALLGDRVRMPSRPEDEGLYIRSLATPSGQQGIALHLPLMAHLLSAFGFENIWIETVGAGQGDTAVRDLVDVLVVLVQPESGDSMQWEKAGLLEVADVVVVHKGDLPGADRTVADLQNFLNLPGTRNVRVIKASAAKNEGIDELLDLVAAARTEA